METKVENQFGAQEDWLRAAIAKSAKREDLKLADTHLIKMSDGISIDFTTTEPDPKQKQGIKSTERTKVELKKNGEDWKIFATSSSDEGTRSVSADIAFNEKFKISGINGIITHFADHPFLTSFLRTLRKQEQASRSGLNSELAPDAWNNARTSVKLAASTVGLTFAMVFSYVVLENAKGLPIFKAGKTPLSVKNYFGARPLAKYLGNEALNEEDVRILAEAYNEAAKPAEPFDAKKREPGVNVAFLALKKLGDDPADPHTLQIIKATNRERQNFIDVALIIIGRETKAVRPAQPQNSNSNTAKITAPPTSKTKEKETKKAETKTPAKPAAKPTTKKKGK